MLLDRQAELTPMLARHGVALDVETLQDPDRHLLQNRAARGQSALGNRLHATLDQLQHQLQRAARVAPAPARSR